MKCARYDDSCDCPACVDDRVKTYTTDDRGAEAGLPGWVGQPAFTHDCIHCSYLGRYDGHDLYHCMQAGCVPTVLARYGDEGHEYKSGLEGANFDRHLGEARRRAAIGGLQVR